MSDSSTSQSALQQTLERFEALLRSGLVGDDKRGEWEKGLVEARAELGRLEAKRAPEIAEGTWSLHEGYENNGKVSLGSHIGYVWSKVVNPGSGDILGEQWLVDDDFFPMGKGGKNYVVARREVNLLAPVQKTPAAYDDYYCDFRDWLYDIKGWHLGGSRLVHKIEHKTNVAASIFTMPETKANLLKPPYS